MTTTTTATAPVKRTVCVQCNKPGSRMNPLLHGRQGYTHDRCDNYR